MRWLAPFLVVLVVLQTASTFAVAGVVDDVTCCCPDIEQCKCHDHDAPVSPTEINRCGGAVSIDVPVLGAIVLPEPPSPRGVSLQAATTYHEHPKPRPGPIRVPEKPPS